MPSRKKSQGKARKHQASSSSGTVEATTAAVTTTAAAAVLQDAFANLSVVQQQGGTNCGGGSCSHGRPTDVRPNDVVSKMYTIWKKNLESRTPGKMMQSFMAITVLSNEMSAEYRNDNFRHKFLKLLVSIGTDSLLKDTITSVQFAKDVAEAIMAVEYVDVSVDMETMFVNIRHLQIGNRNVIKFYSKRTACDCCKEMKQSTKEMAKVGGCFHCQQMYDRTKLQTCVQCKFATYCLRECQRSDWPSHKEYCKTHSKGHELFDEMKKKQEQEE